MTLPNGLEVHLLAKSRSEVIYIYREIFEQLTYTREGIEIRDGDCIVDVGANIGLFTMFVLLGRKRLRVVCLEPLPPIFEALEANIGGALIEDHQVDLINEGIALKQVETELVLYPAAPGNSTAVPDAKRQESRLIASALTMGDFWRRNKWLFFGMLLAFPFRRHLVNAKIRSQLGEARRFRCRLRPLSEVLDERGIETIDLLKIDVEGSELFVLESLREEQWSGIRQLVMEVSPHLTTEIPRLRQELKTRGFSEVSVLDSSGSADGDVVRSLPCTLYARRASNTPLPIDACLG